MTLNYKQSLKEVRKDIKKLRLKEAELMVKIKQDYDKENSVLFKGQKVEKQTHKKKTGIHRSTIWRRLHPRRSSVSSRTV